MKRTQQFTIDGKTYNSLDEMSASVRKKWEGVSASLATIAAHATANPSNTTTVEFEEHVEYVPSEYVRGSDTAGGPPLNNLFATLRANAGEPALVS